MGADKPAVQSGIEQFVAQAYSSVLKVFQSSIRTLSSDRDRFSSVFRFCYLSHSSPTLPPHRLRNLNHILRGQNIVLLKAYEELSAHARSCNEVIKQNLGNDRLLSMSPPSIVSLSQIKVLFIFTPKSVFVSSSSVVR